MRKVIWFTLIETRKGPQLKTLNNIRRIQQCRIILQLSLRGEKEFCDSDILH